MMFASQYFRTAVGCSKRLKVSTPFRPLTTTAPRWSSENDATSNSTRAEPPTDEAQPSKSEADTIPKAAQTPAPETASAAEAATIPEQPPIQRPTKSQSSEKPRATETKPAKPWSERLDYTDEGTRLPLSVQSVYLKPLKRQAEHGLPVCDLQLRSYSTRHVEFFADFALRAAYYLGLPASGPVPLPRITERWTVTKSPFIFKKTQENFERITLRRLVQIKDGHPDVVQAWLSFLRKHAFHGVGMKANVYDHAPLDFVENMDNAAKDIGKALEPELNRFGTGKSTKPKESISKLLETERFSNKHMPLTEVRKG